MGPGTRLGPQSGLKGPCLGPASKRSTHVYFGQVYAPCEWVTLGTLFRDGFKTDIFRSACKRNTTNQ